MIYFDYGLPTGWVFYYMTIYTLTEYLFLAYFIYLAISNRKLRLIIITLSCCFIIFQFSFSLAQHRLDSISIGIETILLFIYIIFFFYDHSNTNRGGYIYNHPVFWLCVGILIYLGGSFFFNILINYMSDAEYNQYWHYTYFAEIIKNFLFLLALINSSKNFRINNLKSTHVPFLDMDMN